MTTSTPAPRARTAPALAAVVAAFFFALPFHRPVLTRALGPALALPELLFPVLVVAIALAVVARPHLRPLPWPGLPLAAVLLVGFAPAVLASDRPAASAAQLAVFLYVVSIYQAAVVVKYLQLGRIALLALVLGATTASLAGIMGVVSTALGSPMPTLSITHPWMSGLTRPVGLTESPTMLAIVAVGGLVAVQALRRDNHLFRSLAWAAWVALAVTLLATRSRTLLAAAAGLGVFIFLLRPRRVCQVAGVGLFAAATAALALTLVWKTLPLENHWPYVDRRPAMYGVCHRIAIRMFLDHPASGVGLERFRAVWPSYYLPERYDVAFSDGREDFRGFPFDPHSTLLGFLAEAGLPGGLTVLGVALLLWRRRMRSPESIAFLVVTFLNSFHTDMLTERSTWALLGLLSLIRDDPDHVEGT